MPNNIYTKTYTITTNNLDRYDDLTPMAMLDLFQDIAGRHAYQIEAGFDDMIKLGLIWVIARHEVNIIKSAPFGEDLTLTTWPLQPSRFYFDRVYEMKDEGGELVAYGRSRWLLIDIDKRRMQPSRVYHYPLTNFLEQSYFKEEFPRLVSVGINHHPCLRHVVRASEIDHNGHFNNARYAELIYNALEPKHKNSITRFLIYYHHEARIGETIDLYLENHDKQVSLSGYKGETLIFTSMIELRNDL